MTDERKGGAKRAGKRRRPWLWVALVAVVVLLIVMALRPTSVEVDLAAVARGGLLVTLDEEGETRVRDRYVISAPVSGQVLRIEIEPGDPVVAGETALVRFQPAAPSLLDDRTRAESVARVEAADAEVGLARAERERARAELEFAEAELRRIAELAESGIVSDETHDSARLSRNTAREALTAAEFSVSTAEHSLAQARARLTQSLGGAGEPITIRSPVGGVVLRRLRESAAVVPAGEPLIEVADPGRLEIVSDFLSEDAVRIAPGAAVRIERWGGDGVLRGRVRLVEPSGFTKISALGVEEQRVNVVIDFEDPREAWEALGDGFRVETRVVAWEGEDVLKVPTSALFRHDEGWAVFVADGDRARLASVDVGWRNGVEAQVLGGLSEGDRVVLHPSDTVADGVGVTARDA